MNQFAKSEQDNETYVMPGTNQVIQAAWQEDLIEGFNPSRVGQYVYKNHYVKLHPNGLVDVEPSDYYQKVNGHWHLVHEDGFQYWR